MNNQKMNIELPANVLPCPCCGSSNLTPNLWSLDDGEVDAVECFDCYAGAPVKSWQLRATKKTDKAA